MTNKDKERLEELENKWKRGKLSEIHKAFNANKPYFICLPATIHVDDRLVVAKEIFLVSHHSPDKYNFAFCDKDCQTIRITVKEE